MMSCGVGWVKGLGRGVEGACATRPPRRLFSNKRVHPLPLAEPGVGCACRWPRH
jgi:hypothetical protein